MVRRGQVIAQAVRQPSWPRTRSARFAEHFRDDFPPELGCIALGDETENKVIDALLASTCSSNAMTEQGEVEWPPIKGASGAWESDKNRAVTSSFERPLCGFVYEFCACAFQASIKTSRVLRPARCRVLRRRPGRRTRRSSHRLAVSTWSAHPQRCSSV